MASRQATREEKPEDSKTSSGIIGSIMRSVGDRYEQVKEAVSTNKPHVDDVTTKNADENVTMVEIGQYTNYDRATEPMESAMDKAREYKDYSSEKAKETKDNALQKAGEYEDYAVDKVKEESEAVSGRMTEMKETASAAARRAMDYITCKGGELDHKALDGGDINDVKYGETEFNARQKMQEMKLKEEGVYDEAKQRAWADKETAADRGVAAKRNIYGAMGTVKDAIREKLTYPTDIVKEARASREYGGPKRGTGDKLVDEVEGGPSGPAAMPSAKASD